MEVNAEMNNSTRSPEEVKRTEDALKVVEESLPKEVSDVVMPRLVEVSRMSPITVRGNRSRRGSSLKSTRRLSLTSGHSCRRPGHSGQRLLL